MSERIGLILTGGGARAAYQVGVLKAIAEYLPRQAHNPFPVICGTSSGALNAAALAVNAHNFRRGVRYLTSIWRNFHTYEVYRTDVVGVFNNTMLWLAGLVLSGLGINRLTRVSLLDNKPLAELLDEIHQLIETTTIRFILTGSSARKLKRGGANSIMRSRWH